MLTIPYQDAVILRRIAHLPDKVKQIALLFERRQPLRFGDSSSVEAVTAWEYQTPGTIGWRDLFVWWEKAIVSAAFSQAECPGARYTSTSGLDLGNSSPR